MVGFPRWQPATPALAAERIEMEDQVFTSHGQVFDEHDEENGGFYIFYPGLKLSEVPERLRSKLSNPKLFSKTPQFGVSNVRGDSGPPDYNSQTVPQLMRLMRERGLEAASTRKADIVAALTEADND